MANTVIMALEGVLAGKDDDIELTQTQLDPVGHLLYASLARSRLVLATKQERRLVDHWCRLNGLQSHSGITFLDDRTIMRARSAGEVVDLYIDHDGDRAAAALRNGVTTIVFSRPLYARAGHRPDLPQLRRPWAEVVRESQAQREARARVSVPDDD